MLLWRLGAGSLAAWDEAIYAQVAKEIARGEGWLTPHWGYAPWFEKPPLLMWVTAGLYGLFGVNEFWTRVPSALSGAALTGVTYLIGESLYCKRVGLSAAAVLLTCYHFLSFSRFGTTDVMLTLFTYLAVYGYLRLKGGGQRWWYLVWTSCALALLVKGAGGLIAPAAVGSALAFDGRLRAATQSRHFWQGCLLALLLVAPWHVLMCARHGRAFTDEYFGYHVIARSTRALEGQASGYFYYLGRLLDGFFPWCLLVPFAVAASVRRGRLEAQSGSRVLLLLSAVVFGLYTLIPTRRPWYIVPLYPALAVLVAAFVVGLRRSYRARPVYRRVTAAASAGFIFTGALYSLVSLYLNHKPEAPVVKLARLARSTSPADREPLVLFSETERFNAQVPLFYSDRPVRQAYASAAPAVEDAKRYAGYENLADVIQDSERRIILHRDDIRRLPNYDIRVLAEADPLIYATIRRKP